MDATKLESTQAPNSLGRVLVIDDNLMDLELVRAILHQDFNLDLQRMGNRDMNWLSSIHQTASSLI
ncbi:MAG: hypothetical protein HOB84_07675 [Candidatus Marinimicrobia bacterium]|jgi:hypothetical protein|nr:hypothetical protein [Candidatus Neomarinimicrobiota bacterium]MBT4035025.1 hypothetical protein [Candidatus Neomarinimicrobiota bacterium]MBT4361905.1 hypothetical protein [Candidatus Neomarinimicrobiota bacterium]MBT4714636.1 hypothetical protein [Candidatus Neomarinimicrobiota bacterium]MBT4945753.1 hypothetical protein [Candidatus Neomarinimicrobiota bacterium]